MNRIPAENRGGRKCAEKGCKREAQHVLNHHDQGGWSHHWCRECDLERIARIDKNLQELAGPRKITMSKKSTKAAHPKKQKLPDTREQVESKLRAIQSQNTIVNNLRVAWEARREEAKEAKKQYENALIGLTDMIRDVPQGELFDQVSREVEED